MAFLTKKSLLVNNQRRAKNYINTIFKKRLFDKIDEIVKKDDLPLEWQESDNVEIFNMALHEVLKEESKIYIKIEK